MVDLGCLFSQWFDECSLHQYCMNNSPFCLCGLNRFKLLSMCFVSKKNIEIYNYICVLKDLIIGGNVNKFNAVLQKICRKFLMT